MAWIESHQSLLTHRKTVRAAAVLKVDRYKLIGHLHALWWWALDNADDDGSLGETMPEEVAEAAGWPAKAAQPFVDALVSVGFFDQRGSCLTLHNWWSYAGKLNAKRATDRARKQGGSVEVAAISSGIPLEVAAKSQAPTNQPTSPTSPTNQPTLLSKKMPFATPEILGLQAAFPSLNTNALWLEFVSWVNEGGEKRRPKDTLAAFHGWLAKKSG